MSGQGGQGNLRKIFFFQNRLIGLLYLCTGRRMYNLFFLPLNFLAAYYIADSCIFFWLCYSSCVHFWDFLVDCMVGESSKLSCWFVYVMGIDWLKFQSGSSQAYLTSLQ